MAEKSTSKERNNENPYSVPELHKQNQLYKGHNR